MTQKLGAFLEAEQQLDFDLDLAIAEAIEDLAEPVEGLPVVQDPGRNGHCEVVGLCRAEAGLQNMERLCGWAGVHKVGWCKKRERLMEVAE